MNQDYNVKFGDIWKMGNHSLLCGDSTESAMIDAFLDGHQPKLCVTDPPYGVSYKSKLTTNGLYQLKVRNDQVISWGSSFKLSNSKVIYVWFSFKHYDVVAKSVQNAGYDIKQMVIWKKPHFSLQRHLYHLQHEQCLVCIRHDVKTSNTWTGDRRQTSIWEVDSVNFRKRIHPTEKPVGVYTIPIENHTLEGDSVLDLFAGSGAIFEAAERTGRQGLGVELCPQASSRILKRMAHLGLEITRESNLFEFRN